MKPEAFVIMFVLVILIILAIALLNYHLGKNYLEKSNSYYKDLYQKAVDKALKKKNE